MLVVIMLWATLAAHQPATGATVGQVPPPVAERTTTPHLAHDTAVRTGDIAAYAQHDWPVRVLVPADRTLFWVGPGGPAGVVPVSLAGFEEHLRTAATSGSAVRVVFVATPLESMRAAIAEGRGEIAADAFTVHADWPQGVLLCEPILRDFDLCVVAGPASRPVHRIEDLSDRPVTVVRGRAGDDAMRALAPHFTAQSIAPPRVERADARLRTEDVLDMVGSGAHEYAVMPRPLAKWWARSIPGLVVTPVSVAAGANAAYAVRSDMPHLAGALNDFVRASDAPARVQAMLEKGDAPHAVPLHSTVSGDAGVRLRELAPLFTKYGNEFGIDPVLVAAQCFQESRFNPKARSHSGAMGLMQLMPATAKELGVRDTYDPQQSIEAGCRYMKWLRDHFFNDPAMSPEVQHEFCLAAYNAGPGTVHAWRERAAQHGLDRNQWFGGVERIARAEGVLQTVDYVSRIAKYAAQFKGRVGP